MPIPHASNSDHEQLIRVNYNDQPVGTLSKRLCHEHGFLHRAFSIWIINSAGEVLLQQRSQNKWLWPGYWSNACCSHPRAGEATGEAVARRLPEELGVSTELGYLYKFVYRADYGNVGSEHEYCSVWIGYAEADQIHPKQEEIADWRFFSPRELKNSLRDHPDSFTPWMKLEWAHLTEFHPERLYGAKGRL